MQKNGLKLIGLLQKGLYAEIFDNTEEMDQAVNNLALEICNSSNKSMKKLKRIFWEGTDHWDDLLNKRAEISGSLILSEFSKKPSIKSKINNAVKTYFGSIQKHSLKFKPFRT